MRCRGGRKSTEKQWIVRKVGVILGWLFGRKKKTEYEELEFSNNNEFALDYVDEDAAFLSIDKGIIEEVLDEEKDSRKIDRTSYIENCCEQMATCSKIIDDAKKEYALVNNYLNDINTIENLAGDQKKQLLYFAKRIRTLNEGKKELRQFTTRMPSEKYYYMQRNEQEMPIILKEMKESEEQCEQLKMDLHNIEGEKFALKQEELYAARVINTITSLFKMSIVTVVIILIILFIAQFYMELDMKVPIYGTVLLGVAAVAIILVMNQKYYAELKITGMKKQKAVRLLNKYRLRYVNAKSILDYSYEKNGVKTSYELAEQWALYLSVKKEQEAYEKTNDELFKTIGEMEDFLNSIKLYDASVWAAQVDAILDGKEMTEVRHTLNVRRQKLRKSIEFNMNTIDRYKQQVKNVMKKNPAIAQEIMDVLDRY